jgi:hypothetical protein
VLARLGVPEGAVAGDRVTLTPDDGEPIDGVIDYRSATMFGVRGPDVLFRVYGRDTWGWPVGVTSHRFANGSEA